MTLTDEDINNIIGDMTPESPIRMSENGMSAMVTELLRDLEKKHGDDVEGALVELGSMFWEFRGAVYAAVEGDETHLLLRALRAYEVTVED